MNKRSHNILALDFGTKTGFCYGSQLDEIEAGSWKLGSAQEVARWGKMRMDRTRDPRIRRLADRLGAFPVADIVVFEDVEFSSYTKQTQLWSSFRTVAWLEYPDTVRFECVPIGTLKKFATGAGNASKEMMETALLRNYPRLWPKIPASLDDNAIDAIWIWLWAQHNLSRISP